MLWLEAATHFELALGGHLAYSGPFLPFLEEAIESVILNQLKAVVTF